MFTAAAVLSAVSATASDELLFATVRAELQRIGSDGASFRDTVQLLRRCGMADHAVSAVIRALLVRTA